MKFNLHVDIKGEQPKIIYTKSLVANKDKSGNNSILGKALEKIWKNKHRPEISESFYKFSKKIKELVSELNDISEIRDKLNIEDIEELPRDFSKISRVFNFYMMEWLSKYAVLCSTLIYNLLLGSSDETIDEYKKKIERIESKLSILIGGKLNEKNLRNIVNLDSTIKFKRIYNLLIDKNFEDTNKDDITTAEKKDTFLFNIKGVHYDDILNFILTYYRDDKKCEYIEIGKDVFMLSDNNPLGLNNCRKFEDVFVNNNNAKFDIVVTTDIEDIKLRVFLMKPPKNQHSGVSFEDIDLPTLENSEFVRSAK